MSTTKNYDVLIIGGSYSGLSAAMALGRSLRSVLIIDSGFPCNRQTPHTHNFITNDGVKPSDIASKAKAEVLKYKTVTFRNDLAVEGKKINNHFNIQTKSGKNFTSKKLIFATGIKDIMPDIRGFSECWGVSIVHCPYCHGYEIRGEKTAIIANGDTAIHLASLINNLTNDLSIITSGEATFTHDQLEKLKKHGIKIIEKEVSEVIHEKGFLNKIHFSDNSQESYTAAYASLPFKQHTDIPESFGCELTEHGHIKVDMMYKTTVEGIYSCGDNSSGMRSVANAVASGNIAGAVLNMELTNEQF